MATVAPLSSRSQDWVEGQSSLAVAGALGAWTAMLIYELLFGMVGVFHGYSARWAVIVIPAILVALVEVYAHEFLLRVGARWRARLGESERAFALFRGYVRGPAAVLVVVVVLLVLQTITERNAAGRTTNLSLLEVLFVTGLITWFWAEGIRRRPPQAGRLGALAGAVGGGLFQLLELLVLTRHLAAGAIFRGVLLRGLAWGIYGFGGGTALERGWSERTGLRVVVGVAAGMLAFAILSFAFEVSYPLGASLFLAVGWGTGIALHQAADILLNVPQTSDRAAREDG